ncbi:sulfate ABC transporter substrate-binding protein [Pasteurellaceae bacterium LFhippo2]|nr:sulfate ABC transporter substrate-binding protein [Pasteurellaceae bacterium LFhippo2]
MKKYKWLMLFLSIFITNSSIANDRMLLVAYDVIRDFYKQYIDYYSDSHQVTIGQSFGGASKQAIAVQNGLPADIVTLNQQNDVDLLIKKGWVSPNWQQHYPNNAVPFYTITVLLVRKGNPKKISDWQDLARSDVKVIFANPKTSGNGRYAYLSLLGFAHYRYADALAQQRYLQKILKNVPLFDAGARAATITFTQREIGDVLVVPENEAALAKQALGDDKFEIIYPSYSARADVFVAEVEKNTARHHNSEQVKSFISSLWQAPAQQIAAQNYFRPTHKAVLQQYQSRFPTVQTFNVNQLFGNWEAINKQHFADGGLFDQLYLGEPK